MIYTDAQLKQKIHELRQSPETEVVEFKEAKNDKSFNEIGQYFSALSNEANIRGAQEAWLLFGIKNNGEICNCNYRKNGGLQNLKREVMSHLNERMTFLEIYEIKIGNNRVVAFQIPPATPGIPTTWDGAAYARVKDSLVPLSLDKLELIRRQIGVDWSKEIVYEADFSDLDPEAVQKARMLFSQKQKDREKADEILSGMSDMELLNKAGLTFKGHITRTALLLLGKPESAFYFEGFTPRITWTLYNADNSIKAYEHFNMPFLLAVDKSFVKIRNERYRYIAGQTTLFPEEVDQYDAAMIKEIINNCIAHSDYRLRGRINIGEYEDHLTFVNEGTFIPETIEKALEPGYKPPYYRNAFLSAAMVNMQMIDTDSIGIPMIYQIQKDKCFPLPSYDLSVPNRVSVTVYGKVLDTNYTQLLHQNNDQLSLRTVFLLDQIQKHVTISKEDYHDLKKSGFVEGRYPNIYVSFAIASLVGQRAQYERNTGLDETICRQLIIKTLKNGPATQTEILEILDKGALSDVLSQEQKSKKVTNLLQKMRREGYIYHTGSRRNGKWVLTKDLPNQK